MCNVAQGLTRFGSKDWKRKPITVHQFSGPATKDVISRLTHNPPMNVLVRGVTVPYCFFPAACCTSVCLSC